LRQWFDLCDRRHRTLEYGVYQKSHPFPWPVTAEYNESPNLL
jgi:hypothetical protein